MQNKLSTDSMSDTLHLPSFKKPFVQQKKRPFLIKEKLNANAVTKLTLKDKAGLVFVVGVLLMLQLLEKLKLLK